MIDNHLHTQRNVRSNLSEPVEPVQDRSRIALDQDIRSGSEDWFLPESSSALREITAPDASGAGLRDVDAITDRILSHIRA